MQGRPVFPREVVADVPRITMTGSAQAHVEQHHGLVAYQMDEVVFATSQGRLHIVGQELRFRLYSAQEAVVTGIIEGIRLERKEERR